MKIDQLETENLILRMWRNEDIEFCSKMKKPRLRPGDLTPGPNQAGTIMLLTM